MSRLAHDTDASAASNAQAGGADSGALDGGSRSNLRGMGFEEGTAAMAPDPDGSPVAAREMNATVIQISGDEWDKEHRSFHNTALIGLGKNAGLKARMLVMADGVYRGMVQSVFANRTRVKFFGGIPTGTRKVTIHPGKTWSKDKWVAFHKRGRDNAEKAGSTKHDKRERGNE